LINARAETAAALPAFRDAFRSRRCLIAADGFYEWQKRDGRRQPFAFTMADDEVFGFAGLWDRWRTPGGAFLQSCAILTTTPNQLVADVHDRMPVILQPDSYDLWLDPGFSNVAALREMLQPFPAGAMRKHAVSERVNSVKNDDAGVCEPPAAAQAAQTGLFA
ncbi:MAG TPA: SOS response-associated peptidase, partial [Terriglobales bacterium]|nr:SOS response-associated peptidase [Terriglobales bacterium]